MTVIEQDDHLTAGAWVAYVFWYMSINSFIIYISAGFLFDPAHPSRKVQILEDCSRTILKHFTHRLQRFIGKRKNV